MLLSIVVPVYNVERYLGRCLRSLLDQDIDAADYEILVINDGSRDGSLEIANSFARDHSNIVVQSQENQGHGAARNAGTRLATGRYIWFVDSDDYVASNVLGKLIDLMDRERLQVLAFGYSSVGPDDDVGRTIVESRVLETVDVVSGLHYMASHSNYPNTVWRFILDTGFLVASGIRFEEGRLLQDIVFSANVISAASRMVVVPIDVYRYVQRPGSEMHPRSADDAKPLIVGYEGVVFGLEELRQRSLKSGTASEAFLNRLMLDEQLFVFFMIARLIRSGVPMRPTLPDALERLRTIGIYPLTRFPGPEHTGFRYSLLTSLFNREYLLYPFARAVRLLYRLRS